MTPPRHLGGARAGASREDGDGPPAATLQVSLGLRLGTALRGPPATGLAAGWPSDSAFGEEEGQELGLARLAHLRCDAMRCESERAWRLVGRWSRAGRTFMTKLGEYSSARAPACGDGAGGNSGDSSRRGHSWRHARTISRVGCIPRRRVSLYFQGFSDFAGSHQRLRIACVVTHTEEHRQIICRSAAARVTVCHARLGRLRGARHARHAHVGRHVHVSYAHQRHTKYKILGIRTSYVGWRMASNEHCFHSERKSSASKADDAQSERESERESDRVLKLVEGFSSLESAR